MSQLHCENVTLTQPIAWKHRFFYFLALNKSNDVFARAPTSDILQTHKETRFHFSKNKAGMLYEVLVTYSAASIKNLDSIV